MQIPNISWEYIYDTSGRNISYDEYIFDDAPLYDKYIQLEWQKKLLELAKTKFNIFNMSNKKDNDNDFYLKLMKDDV